MGVKSAIVFINGFRQNVAPGVGLQSLYFEATRLWFDRRRDLVIHRTWDSDPEETAGLILSHEPEKIFVVGYSYGCGWGLTKLAGELDVAGRDIDAAFLIDPVTRYSVQKWRSLGWFARKDKLVYSVPARVRRVFSWRQVNAGSAFEPVGHRVEASDPRTVVHPEVVLGTPASVEKHSPDTPIENRRTNCWDCSHYTIDSNPVVRLEVLEALSGLNPIAKDAE